jgi:hypothetical protein
MENHKIDRLFQDKLSRHEVDPSPQAWEAINAELKKDNKPFIWLSIAASVALVATIGWFVLKNEQVGEINVHAYATVDQPSLRNAYEWNLPLPAENSVVPKQETKKVVKSEKAKRTSEFVGKENVAVEVTAPKLNGDEVLLDIEPIGMDAMANIVEEPMVVVESELDTTPIQSLPGVSVQITYKATPSVPVEEKSRIERLWAKAKEIRPGEMLADIRETKNDFFNGKKN